MVSFRGFSTSSHHTRFVNYGYCQPRFWPSAAAVEFIPRPRGSDAVQGFNLGGHLLSSLHELQTSTIHDRPTGDTDEGGASGPLLVE